MIALRLLLVLPIACCQLVVGLVAGVAWTLDSAVRYVRTGRWTLRP